MLAVCSLARSTRYGGARGPSRSIGQNAQAPRARRRGWVIFGDVQRSDYQPNVWAFFHCLRVSTPVSRVRNDDPVRATRPVDGSLGESCTRRFNDWCYWACWSAAYWSHFRHQRTQPPTRSLGLQSLTRQVPAHPPPAGYEDF